MKMAALRSLEFSPADQIVFSPLDEKYRAVLTITNTSESLVVFKVKTHIANRYMVKPHIGLLGPQESRQVAIFVPHDQEAAFLAGIAQQAQEEKLQTAFLVLGLRLNDDAATIILKEPSESFGKKLSAMWKEIEASEKGSTKSSRSAFEQKKFSATIYDAEEDGLDGETDSRADESSLRTANQSLGNTSPVEIQAPRRQAAISLPPEPVAPLAVSRTEAPAPTSAAPDISRLAKSTDQASTTSAASSNIREKVSPYQAATPKAQATVMTVEEALSMRTRVTELMNIVVSLTGDRDGLTTALERRERELDELRKRVVQLEHEAAALQAGVRPRPAAGAADDDEDDTSLEVNGFPLWQVIVIAIIALLVGRIMSSLL